MMFDESAAWNRFRIVAIALALLMASGLDRHSRAQQATLPPPDITRIAARVFDGHISPGYARLAGATSGLKAALDAHCAAPGNQTRARVDSAFSETVRAWGRIEHIRFGPIARQNRAERITFWPDRRGIGARQMRKLLAKRDSTALSPAMLSKKSVALQGLSALERLLFGSGAASLGADNGDGRFRCGYAVAISENLRSVAAKTYEGWTTPDGFAASFIAPGRGNIYYQSPKEVLQELHKSLMAGSFSLRLKVGYPMGVSPDLANPNRAPFRSAGITVAYVSANLNGLSELFSLAFAEVLAPRNATALSELRRMLAQTAASLAAIKLPIERAIFDAAERPRLADVVRTAEHILNSGGAKIAKAADLTIGFNAYDGDGN